MLRLCLLFRFLFFRFVSVCNIDNKRKRECNGDGDGYVKRKQQVKLSQGGTEFHSEMLLANGASGIIAKNMNAAMNENFNSSILYFGYESALSSQYKRVFFEMRLHSKWEKANAIASGGGPMTPKSSEIIIEPTGSIIEVFQRFGHLTTDRVPFDSNGPMKANIAVDESDKVIEPMTIKWTKGANRF